MTNLEIIERLCAVVEEQSKIIKKQAIFIEEQCSVDEEIKSKFIEGCTAIDDKISNIYKDTAITISQ